MKIALPLYKVRPPEKSNNIVEIKLTNDPEVIESLQNQIKLAAEKGVKVIPIVASGINKETEFLMRSFALATNGTYVFITDDSGVGNSHLEPTVGDFDVEYLNDLIVRLVNEYSTL